MSCWSEWGGPSVLRELVNAGVLPDDGEGDEDDFDDGFDEFDEDRDDGSEASQLLYDWGEVVFGYYFSGQEGLFNPDTFEW